MTRHIKLPVSIFATLAACLFLAGSVSQASAQPAQPTQSRNAVFTAFGSCSNSKPFKPAKRCRYDSKKKFRGTFVFRSKIGKLKIKACFRVFGRAPLGGGHACAKVGPQAFKAYPFTIAGVRQPFRVKFTWYVKDPSRNDPFSKAATSVLKVRP